MMLLLLLLQLSAVLAHSGSEHSNVALTVSSLKTPLDGEGPNVIQRQLEMVWEPMPDAEWLGLFTVSPPQKASEGPAPLVRINPSDYPGGYYRTNVSLPRDQYPNGWKKGSKEKPVPGDACMPFWIAAYNKNDELLYDNCIKIRPTWMGDHRTKLEILTLADLFIPGTHSAATYNRESTVGPIGHYVLTQDTDIWGQLVHGIRYLDLNIRHCYGGNATAYTPIAQDVDRFRKLVNVDGVTHILEEIKDYMKRISCEIVILDIQEFPPGFDEHASNHHQFVSLVHSVLGEFVLPFSNISYNSTLAEVWETGRNLIVAYNHPETVKEFDWLWPPITHKWLESNSPQDVKEFLQECIDNARISNETTFWVASAFLKPSPIDFMFGGAKSLRELADKLNQNLTRWFMDEWWEFANIVSTDFFLGNTIIDTAVKSCLDKANNLTQSRLDIRNK
ncbi:PI-PLC X domain-containing protein 1-like [Schistocerca americana]|uniref:PI-PLC X domain-containing protein 1-like n=1 Tax=Schistocerca americana TaxID=7009 RepID=UPI001F4F3EF4|nr:PI-PLC X domain-containing protein 1-like [Schistocerca americana]XP_049953090.1 PI-PLC X domain-containing protein 1-like [Schistocerca serialis cubense]